MISEKTRNHLRTLLSRNQSTHSFFAAVVVGAEMIVADFKLVDDLSKLQRVLHLFPLFQIRRRIFFI